MAVLKLDASEPPGRHDRLMDLGFDSLMAVQLRNALGTGLGLEQSRQRDLVEHRGHPGELGDRLGALRAVNEGCLESATFLVTERAHDIGGVVLAQRVCVVVHVVAHAVTPISCMVSLSARIA